MKKWLKEVLSEHGEGYQTLMQQYRENADNLYVLLVKVLNSICKLPVMQEAEGKTKRELLAVFAAKTTGDPHYYDEGTVGDKLLTAFLKYCYKLVDDRNLTYVERKSRLLYEAGLLKDDLSNDTLVYGIHALQSDGKIHEGIKGFCIMKEPVRLTLMTVGNLEKVWAQHKENIVYVVENPAVFSLLVQKYPEGTFICGNGQPRLATLLLMDMMQENCTFYYAGDFDPEGLLIAQRLKKRYGEKLILWNYEVKCYEEYLSSVPLSTTRLKKLERVELAEFQELKKRMYQKKRAAYQETMLERYL